MNNCKDCNEPIDFMNSAICVKCGSMICNNCSVNNKFMCKDCNQPDEEIHFDFIRRSHIEDYMDCPYYFYLANVKGHKEEFSIEIQLGIDLHDLFEHWQDGTINDVDIMYQKVEDILEKLADTYGQDESDRIAKRAWDSLKTFLEVIPTLQNEILALEETIFFYADTDISPEDDENASKLPKIRITMDRVDMDEEGNLHLHDWKTGRVMVGKQLSSNLQVPLYIKAVENKYKRKVMSFTLYYLSENKTRTYWWSHDDVYTCLVRKREYKTSIKDALKTVQTVFARIKKRHFSVPDKPSFIKCKLCSFKEQQLCMGGGYQDWKHGQEERESIKKDWGQF